MPDDLSTRQRISIRKALEKKQAYACLPNHLFIFDTSGYSWIAYKVQATGQVDRYDLCEVAAFDERQLNAVGS
jgi:hypothetical protein